MDAVATRTIDASAFIVPVVKFPKHVVKKWSLVQAQIEDRRKKLVQTVEEVRLPPVKNNASKPRVPDEHFGWEEAQHENPTYVDSIGRVRYPSLSRTLP